MKLTKTWLSYILWGLFSVILFTDIGISAVEIYQKTDAQITWIPIVSMYAYAFLGVIAIILIYKLIEKFILPKLGEETPVLGGVAEVFALVTVLIIAVAVRLITVISATGGLEGTTEFYDYAVTVIGNKSLDVHSNGAYIYGNVLSFFLGFLGYKATAAMAVQAGIQIITIIVAYFAVKKGLGRLNAWLCFLMMSFLPGSFMAIRECTPNSLFTLFFVLYLLCLVFLCEANRAQKIKEKYHALFYVLIGVFSAFLAYYDVIGLVTAVIGIVAIIKTKNEDAWTTTQRAWFQLLLFIISFVFGFVLMMWFMPMNGYETGPASLINYWIDCIPSFELNLMLLSPHKGQWDSLALFVLSGLWFAGFLRDDKDNAFPYVIMIDVMTVLVFLGIGTSDYTSLSSFTWIMLSAIGFSSLRRFRRNEKDIAAAEKAKKDNAARKEARERKRSAVSGEKEIRLDHVNTQPRKEVSFEEKTIGMSAGVGIIASETVTKKGYGIGRKEETVKEPAKTADVPKPIEKAVTAEPPKQIEMPKAVQEIKPVVMPKEPVAPKTYEPEMVIIKKEPVIKQDVSPAQAEAAVNTKPVVQEAKVAQVESRPAVTPPAPTPVESKPAYSYGSPSRRPLRMPSKSTFSPEELERIRQYTGMNITPPQQPILNNHVRREEKVLTPGETTQEVQTNTAPAGQTIAQQQVGTSTSQPVVQTQPVSTVTRPQAGTPVAQPVVKPQTAPATQSKPQSDNRQPKLIRNPLPGPKPHVSRELNYDYMPKTSEMKYDIEDLKGRDYFDI